MKATTEKIPLAGPRSIKLFKPDVAALAKLSLRTNRSIGFFVRQWTHERLARLRNGNGYYRKPE
jgi:hypothetical protein